MKSMQPTWKVSVRNKFGQWEKAARFPSYEGAKEYAQELGVPAKVSRSFCCQQKDNDGNVLLVYRRAKDCPEKGRYYCRWLDGEYGHWHLRPFYPGTRETLESGDDPHDRESRAPSIPSRKMGPWITNTLASLRKANAHVAQLAKYHATRKLRELARKGNARGFTSLALKLGDFCTFFKLEHRVTVSFGPYLESFPTYKFDRNKGKHVEGRGHRLVGVKVCVGREEDSPEAEALAREVADALDVPREGYPQRMVLDLFFAAVKAVEHLIRK